MCASAHDAWMTLLFDLWSPSQTGHSIRQRPVVCRVSAASQWTEFEEGPTCLYCCKSGVPEFIYCLLIIGMSNQKLLTISNQNYWLLILDDIGKSNVWTTTTTIDNWSTQGYQYTFGLVFQWDHIRWKHSHGGIGDHPFNDHLQTLRQQHGRGVHFFQLNPLWGS